MPKIWVPTNVLDINLRPGGDNSDLNSWNKVTLLCHCAGGARVAADKLAVPILHVHVYVRLLPLAPGSDGLTPQ